MSSDTRQIDQPVVRLGEIPVRVITVTEAAEWFVQHCTTQGPDYRNRPLYATSVNGHVISAAWRNRDVKDLIRRADVVDCDGQPMVILSKFLCSRPLKERVATTDLFPVLARMASQRGLSFYLLGATEEVNRRVVQKIAKAYPSLSIAGSRSGYFSQDEEPEIIADIQRARPDILWVAMGVPNEQEFCVRNLDRLRGVGIVKTSGGLFDFLSGDKPRAPLWMQKAGLEWLFRSALEPRRLLLRYLVSNPHAFVLLMRHLR